MAGRLRAGFTIIESMLVLGLSGALLAALLIGVGSSINVQRYRDSVTSLQSLLRTQYSELENVRNDRDGDWRCDAAAQPVQGGTTQTPGQSDCVLLGRYVGIVGGEVTAASIVGFKTGNDPGNDIESIRKNYALGISPITIEKTALEWNVEIAWPTAGADSQSGGGSSRSIAIVMLRSPQSGTLYTFTSNTVFPVETITSESLKTVIVAGKNVPGQDQRTICIASGGLLLAGGDLAVYIGAYASGPNSIEIRTNDLTQSLGGDTKC